MFDDAEPMIQKLYDGFEFLLKSKKIKDIFEHTLAIGNYINGTSARGGAFGFKVEAIEKTNDVKYEDNKRTLIMYIIELIQEKHSGEAFLTKEEMDHIEVISRMPVSQVRTDLGEINLGFRSLQKAIDS